MCGIIQIVLIQVTHQNTASFKHYVVGYAFCVMQYLTKVVLCVNITAKAFQGQQINLCLLLGCGLRGRMQKRQIRWWYILVYMNRELNSNLQLHNSFTDWLTHINLSCKCISHLQGAYIPVPCAFTILQTISESLNNATEMTNEGGNKQCYDFIFRINVHRTE